MLRKFKYPLLFLLLIAAIKFLFPFQVHIENALTEFAAVDYGIEISPVRVLFEPIAGPLLYALRGDQPLIEFFVTVLWLMALLLPVLVIQNKRKGRSAGRAVLKWLAVLPVILVAWIALLIVLVFAPLPANKIIKPDQDHVLLNIHSHSHWSHDGLISPEGLMKWHRNNNFDAFFLTEHNHHRKTLELVRAQEQQQVPGQPLVLAGEEYSASNHILLLGLKRDFRTKEMPDSTAIDSVQVNGGVAIVAHWFAGERNSLPYYINQGADGFEVINQAVGITYDRNIFDNIVKAASSNGLLMMGSCDYHGYGSAALVWNALEIPGWRNMNITDKRESIMNILRNHEQDKIKVLVYRDRTPFARSLVLLSPMLNLIGYFRTLTVWQLLSWIIWILVFGSAVRLIRRIGFSSRSTWSVLGLASSVFTAAKGVHLLSKAGPLKGYNEIYAEYGRYFLWAGILFAIYSAIMFLSGKIRFPKSAR